MHSCQAELLALALFLLLTVWVIGPLTWLSFVAIFGELNFVDAEALGYDCILVVTVLMLNIGIVYVDLAIPGEVVIALGQVADEDSFGRQFATVHVAQILRRDLNHAHRAQEEFTIFSTKFAMMDALSGHHYDLVRSLPLSVHGYLFSRVDVHSDRLLTQLLCLGLQRVLVILLISLIDPEHGKAASSIDR